MAKVLQHRRGTTAEHANFTGAAGEVTVDTTDKRLVVHDGSTKGGVPAAKKSEIVAIESAVDKTAEDLGGLQQSFDQEKADIRALIADELKKYLPLAGERMQGPILFEHGSIVKGDKELLLLGGNDGVDDGTKAVICLRGSDHPAPGSVVIGARNGSSASYLTLGADGSLWADNKNLRESEFFGSGTRLNPITSTAEDTTARWRDLGGGTYWFHGARGTANQPSDYGFLINYVAYDDVFQLFKEQRDGALYFRAGNASGWGDVWVPFPRGWVAAEGFCGPGSDVDVGAGQLGRISIPQFHVNAHGQITWWTNRTLTIRGGSCGDSCSNCNDGN